MAKRAGSGRTPARRNGSARKGGTPRTTPKGGTTRKDAAKKSDAARSAPEDAAAPASVPFVLGAIPGATPGKWIDVWHERMPRTPLELRPLDVAGQRSALVAGDVDAALVRLPIDRDGLHVIALYDELPVVVVNAESHLTAAEELDLADLAGEVVIVPRDDVLSLAVPHAAAPVFDAPESTEEAIATVGAGVGIVVVPMSLARLHHRKDTAYRVLRDGPTSTVALAWVADRTTPAVDAFVGIVRGRTANSSRG